MSERRVLATVWSGMGYWRWVCLLLVLVALVLTPLAGPSRAEWLAVPPLAGSGSLPVALESRCRASSDRCRWRLRVEGGGSYRWREAASDSWTVVEGRAEGSDRVQPISLRERRPGRIEVCTTGPSGRCARWNTRPVLLSEQSPQA